MIKFKDTNWHHLYKRNAKGEPIFWSGRIANGLVTVQYGLLTGTIHEEIIRTNRNPEDELKSRVYAKRKEGYKALTELKDSTTLDNAIHVFDGDYRNQELLNYLKTYLPKYSTTAEGFVLPMLAKTLEDNKPFEKYGAMRGQWKINGLRCIIGATEVHDLFDKIKLTYHSREGLDWTDKLNFMDDIIIPQLGFDLLYMMSHEGVCLDGELYVPGYTVNDINSFVKNTALPQHKLLQYWMYDIAIDNMTAESRADLIINQVGNVICNFDSKDSHLNNTKQFVVLPNKIVTNFDDAIDVRNHFIDLGFEGLILRNPNNEYQFGKRNASMFKFKKKDDGLFEIVDIKSDKRGLPIYVLKNDINENLFECTINLPQDKQRQQLEMKDTLIGKKGLVEFRERSGVQQVPFHAKLIKIYI